MIFVIDIGNTNTVFGIFDQNRLVSQWRLVSSHTRTVDEYWIAVRLLASDSKIDFQQIEGVIISSVVPDLTQNVRQMAVRYLNQEPLVVSHRLNLGLQLLVDNPAELGADRICNAVAGKEHYPRPQIIVDLGTATTFDILNEAGDYVGGSIAPGMLTAAAELIHKAAQLYRVEWTYPAHLVGRNTREHLQGGVFVGHIAMIEGLIQRLKAELHWPQVHVVATGGLCEEIVRYAPFIDDAAPQLTLEGLHLLYQRNS